MSNEKTKKSLLYLKDIVILILLLICCMLPLFRQFTCSLKFTIKNEYTILKVIGFIGIVFLIGYLISGLKKTDNSKKYLKNNLPIILFTIYMMWTLISCFMSPNKQNAFNGTDFRKDGYISYIMYAGIFSLALCLKSEQLKKILLNMFLLIAILGIIFIEIPKNGYLQNMFWQNDHVRGVFYNLNHYGYYLLIANAIAVFLFVTEEKILNKILYCIAYTYLLCYLIINNTFGCYLALLGTLILFLAISIIKKHNIKISLITIGIFVFVTIFANIFNNTTSQNIKQLGLDLGSIVGATSSKELENNNKETYMQAGSGRMEIWIDGLKFFANRPVLGYGPENLRPMYEADEIDQDRPHNIIIQQLTTSGLPGCILYFTALGIIILKGLKSFNAKNSIYTVTLFNTIAYLISAMFGNSMYYTSPYFFIVLGLLMNEIIKVDNCEKGKEIGEIQRN